jgi:AcrR family transcriptional regulator
MAKIDKQAVIQEAATLANKEGLNKVTLKELAHRLNIRSPSLYNHVDGLDDLYNSIMLYGWKQLGDAVALSAVGKSGGDAVRAMCKSYYDYATENPGVFEAMMRHNQSSSSEAEQASKGLANLTALILSGYNLDDEEKIHASRMFRSFLQGFSSLVNKNSFSDPVSVDGSFSFAIEILINGLAAIKQ